MQKSISKLAAHWTFKQIGYKRPHRMPLLSANINKLRLFCTDSPKVDNRRLDVRMSSPNLCQKELRQKRSQYNKLWTDSWFFLCFHFNYNFSWYVIMVSFLQRFLKMQEIRVSSSICPQIGPWTSSVPLLMLKQNLPPEVSTSKVTFWSGFNDITKKGVKNCFFLFFSCLTIEEGS